MDCVMEVIKKCHDEDKDRAEARLQHTIDTGRQNRLTGWMKSSERREKRQRSRPERPFSLLADIEGTEESRHL